MSEITAPATAPSGTTAAPATSAAPGTGLGGASTTPQAAPAAPAAITTPPAQSGPWSWAKEDGTFNDGWRDRLPDDLKGVKDLEKYKDLTSLARTVVHQQKMIGADKLPLPGKNATPEEWAKWDGWNKLGRPETPEQYDLKALKPVGDGIPYDYKGESAMVAKMHALGMTQHQVAGLLAEYRASVGGQFGELTKSQQVAQAQAAESIRQEYGAAFNDKMMRATNYVQNVLGEGADEVLKANQFNPQFIKLMVAASEATREDRQVNGKSSTLTGALSPAEAKAEYDAMMSEAFKDKAHPLWNKADPKYATLNARRLQLHEFMNVK